VSAWNSWQRRRLWYKDQASHGGVVETTQMKKGTMSLQNLEAKFRLDDLVLAEEQAQKLGYTRRMILNQRDTFFVVPNGKLKLREENGPARLIFYAREESGPLSLSSYDLVKVAEPEATRAMLSAALGVLAVVSKERILMMRDNIRLHLDRVEGLGSYGEIEAVIAAGDDPENSRGAVEELLRTLEVDPLGLIDVSYFELLLARDSKH
jgi:predicted adenylyl cyclase CyaB